MSGTREGERERSRRGVTFYARRERHHDATVYVKRFPRVPDAASRAFVLVHGIGVSSRYFHPVAAELARHGEVYLVDLPGYGRAPDPHHDVSIEGHARVLGRFIEHAGLDNPVLVGHSMGTQVVSRLAVDSPELSDRVVLMAPTVTPGERRLSTQARHLLRDITMELPWVNAIVATDYLFRCGVPYFLAQSKHLLGDRIEDRLPFLRANTLVLRGDADPIVPRAWAQRVAAAIPWSSYAEVVGPHIVMWSDARRTAEHIVRHAAS